MSEHMYDLKKMLDIILDFIKDRNDVIFMDYPLHYNVGDLLILHGTLNFFKEKDIKIKNNINAYNFNIGKVKKNITSNTTILCHGGGNFGDIYDIHQNLRERIVQEFPDNTIIILPQTAFFYDLNKLEKSKKIFQKHNNVIMLARDNDTYVIFKEFSKKTYLMPDMAHYLYGFLPLQEKSNKGKLYFLRKDVEKNPIQDQLKRTLKNSDIYDWEDLLTRHDKRILYITNKLISLNKYLKLDYIDDLIFRIWQKHTHSLVLKFSKLFSSYDEIVTSRLHGHILSCLVDTPSYIIDNSYGKNTAYYQCWTKQLAMAYVLDK